MAVFALVDVIARLPVARESLGADARVVRDFRGVQALDPSLLLGVDAVDAGAETLLGPAPAGMLDTGDVANRRGLL
jgi:hypothetical protein